MQQETTLTAGSSEVVSIPINHIPLIAAKLAGDYTLYARTTDAFGQIFRRCQQHRNTYQSGIANLQTVITSAVAPQGPPGLHDTISITTPAKSARRNLPPSRCSLLTK